MKIFEIMNYFMRVVENMGAGYGKLGQTVAIDRNNNPYQSILIDGNRLINYRLSDKIDINR